MFPNFCSKFGATYVESPDVQHKVLDSFRLSVGAVQFLQCFAGQTFKNGLYRIHPLNDIKLWTSTVMDVFPEFKGNVMCFSYDWLGRHFALDFSKTEGNEPTVLMFELGTGDVLDIPTAFLRFHEEELIDYQDAALASEFFEVWRESNKKDLLPSQCVGYKVPLFLGGEDKLANLKLLDMGMYWHLCGQLLAKVKHLSEGTPIDKFTISGE